MVQIRQDLHMAVRLISAAQGSLFPDEASLLDGATPARAREIAAGRILGRVVLAELSCLPTAILRAPSGAPIWPPGFCGSISHSRRHVAVAVARTTAFDSIGIDIEDGRSLGASISDVASGVELEGLGHHLGAENSDDAGRMIHSAKEALFKCQAPVTDCQDLDFLDIRLEPDFAGTAKAVPVTCTDQKTIQAINTIKIFFEEIQQLTVTIAIMASALQKYV